MNARLHKIGANINRLGRLSPKLAGRVALELFIRPRRKPLRPLAAERLAEAEQLKALPGIRGYRWAGKEGSPRVLLLHGWQSNSSRWLPLIDRLLPLGFEVLAFDAPASGKSVGRRLGFDRYVKTALRFNQVYGPFDAWAGHSLGGGVVLQSLKRLPSEQRPLAAIAMATFDESEHVFDRYQELLHFDQRVRRQFERHVNRLIDDGKGIRAYSNVDAARSLGEVKGLIVHSQDDDVCPYEEALRIRDAWPGCAMISFEDQRHWLRGSTVDQKLEAWLVGQFADRLQRTDPTELAV